MIIIKLLILGGALFLNSGRASGELLLAKILTSEETAKVKELLNTEQTNYEAAEKEYQNLIHRQIIYDLLALYDLEEQGKIQLTLADFTPENSLYPGLDKGFGLHVIKRAGIEIGNGRKRMITVNEHWPEDKESGGILLPDEIRIKTQVYEGTRHVRGSEKLYLFDSLKLGWDSNAQVILCRRSQYSFDPVTGKRGRKQVRVPVSAPYACQDCHEGNNFAQHFLLPGESRSYESIVQDAYFNLPLKETNGYKKYIKHLELTNQRMIEGVKVGRVSNQWLANLVEKRELFLDAAKRDLLSRESMRLPGIQKGLLAALRQGICWLGNDVPFDPNNPSPGYRLTLDSHGIYRSKNGNLFRDAIENELEEGKYRWWEPLIAIPRASI